MLIDEEVSCVLYITENILAGISKHKNYVINGPLFSRGLTGEDLKVVSATFLLVCFVYLKETKRKNAFCFTSKSLLVL